MSIHYVWNDRNNEILYKSEHELDCIQFMDNRLTTHPEEFDHIWLKKLDFTKEELLILSKWANFMSNEFHLTPNESELHQKLLLLTKDIN